VTATVTRRGGTDRGLPLLEALRRQADFWIIGYRRTWRGSVVTSFLEPVLYLLAMGVGIGSYVNSGARTASLGGLTYLDYVAPALLAATAMQIAMGECTYAVLAKVKWNASFVAMVATPLRPRDLVIGQLGFAAARVLQTVIVFLAVIAIAGAVGSPLGLLCLPAGVLIGLAFAAPLVAFAVRIEDDSAFSLVYRLGLIPMFLFSGAFFPVKQLPNAIEWLAYVSPLWHGVELCRQFATGQVHWAAAGGHVAYLLAWTGAGTWLAVRGLQKRLIA
jgi:lipooligosaccharide transport system permease protein